MTTTSNPAELGQAPVPAPFDPRRGEHADQNPPPRPSSLWPEPLSAVPYGAVDGDPDLGCPDAVGGDRAGTFAPEPHASEDVVVIVAEDDATTAVDEAIDPRTRATPMPAGRRRGTPNRVRRLATPAEVAQRGATYTAPQRLLILDTWQRSGLPAGDYAPLVGVSKHTLYAWKRSSRRTARPVWPNANAVGRREAACRRW